MSAKFNLGRVVATPGALAAFERNGQIPLAVLTRHIFGDWGELDPEDHEANDRALVEGSRIFSSYLLKDNTKVWVITEASRESTCILLPEDY